MSGGLVFEVDPRSLYLPTTRPLGADPAKLQRQIARFGPSTESMPPLEVYSDTDGWSMIWNGVTRATRVAKLLPGTKIRVELLGTLNQNFRDLPTVGDRLP